MSSSLPAQPSLEQLKKQAKDLLKDFTVLKPEALKLIRDHLPAFAGKTDAEIAAGPFALHDAQSVIARQYGFRSWKELADHVEGRVVTPAAPEPPPDVAEKLAIALKARETNDYALFCSIMSPEMIAYVTKERFEETSARMSTIMKAGYQVTYMGFVNHSGRPIHFWRMWVEGWETDLLVRMAINNAGKVSGLLYSPPWDSAVKK